MIPQYWKKDVKNILPYVRMYQVRSKVTSVLIPIQQLPVVYVVTAFDMMVMVTGVLLWSTFRHQILYGQGGPTVVCHYLTQDGGRFPAYSLRWIPNYYDQYRGFLPTMSLLLTVLRMQYKNANFLHNQDISYFSVSTHLKFTSSNINNTHSTIYE